MRRSAEDNIGKLDRQGRRGCGKAPTVPWQDRERCHPGRRCHWGRRFHWGAVTTDGAGRGRWERRSRSGHRSHSVRVPGPLRAPEPLRVPMPLRTPGTLRMPVPSRAPGPPRAPGPLRAPELNDRAGIAEGADCWGRWGSLAYMGRERCHSGRQRALDDTFHEGALQSSADGGGTGQCAPRLRPCHGEIFVSLQCRYVGIWHGLYPQTDNWNPRQMIRCNM